MIHYISSEWLTIERLEEIFDNKYQIALSDDAIKRISHCRSYLDEKMKNQKEPIYGITTGFGSLCNISIDREQLSQLQKKSPEGTLLFLFRIVWLCPVLSRSHPRYVSFLRCRRACAI